MMSGDLSALVARLEAVTTRLESAADRASGGEQGMISQTLRCEGELTRKFFDRYSLSGLV